MDRLGAAVDVEPAGHDAIGAKPALDAAIHRGPQPVEPLFEPPPADPRLLVGALHLGDGEAGIASHGQHLSGIAEGVRDIGRVGLHLAARQLRFADDEAAADRIVDPAQQQRAVGIIGIELQAIGVAGQPLLLVVDQVERRPEAIGRVSLGMHQALGLDPGDDRIDPVGIDGIRCKT